MLWFLYHLIFRFNASGMENIPKTGPVILCGNHIHAFDPVTMIVSVKRRLFFLAKKEIFKGRLFSAVLRKMNVIPLDREKNDMQAYRAAVGGLEDGLALCIFAQGTRMKELDIKNVKSGVALFALKTGATVVPAFISGRYGLFRRLNIVYGQPVDLADFAGQKLRSDVLDQATERIMEKVAKLAA
jgi:1-acyl-sn-glycerol-3-phosphate acyltransferase